MPIEIKNLLFQPLCLHLAGDGSKSLHLNPREKRLIQAEEVSEEIRRAVKELESAEQEIALGQEQMATSRKVAVTGFDHQAQGGIRRGKP